MAGDWLKVEYGLSRKQEVIQMAKRVRHSRREVAMMCIEIWEWASQNAAINRDQVDAETFCALAGGVTSSRSECDTVTKKCDTPENRIEGVALMDLEDLDLIVDCPGLGQAMCDIGWVVVEAPGIVRFTRWDRHNSNSAKARIANAERKRKSRGSPKRDIGHGESVTVSRSERDKSVTDVTKKRDQRREEKRRDEEPPPPPTGGAGVGGGKTSDPPDPPPPRKLPLIPPSDLRDRERVEQLVADRLEDPTPADLEGAWRLAAESLEQTATEPGAYFHRRCVDRVWPERKAPAESAYARAMSAKTQDAFRRMEPKPDSLSREEAQARVAAIRAAGLRMARKERA